MAKKWLSLAVLLLLLGVSFLSACSQAPSAPEPAAPPKPLPAATPTPAPFPTPAPPKGPQFDVGDSSVGVAGPELPSAERMIVRQGSLVLVVADLAQAVEKAAETAQNLGGYVIYSSQQGEEGASISMRVPAEKFEPAMASLKALALRVVNEDTRSQDVTEEYVDLEASLRNLEAAEAQYLEILKKAWDVEGMLQVQRELVNVRGQIEGTRGRMNYLERTTAMSQIDVSFQPSKSPQPLVRPEWSPGETLRGALRSLASFGQRLAGLGIWLLVFSPVWIVPGLIIFFVLRRSTRRPG
ncbi:MAG: DUF4349 domain-containing protein [Chloroflexi bacterium]|nr:DUF4349 domain-containing protein [Chloroflexota bacterium]